MAHAAIDAHSRVDFVQMYPNEQRPSVAAFLEAAVAHYKALGVSIKRRITDDVPACGSQLFARACQALGIKHTFPPLSPRPGTSFRRACVNGPTGLPACGRIWANSQERTA